MITVEKFLSPLIKQQFPEFYSEQGPLFILFAEEFFRWLESNDSQYSNYSDAVKDGNYIYHLRRLLEYRDIDTTIDEFHIHFREKFLLGIGSNAKVSQARLIKAAKDIFSSKGTDRSFDLLFKILFNTSVEIYVPGNDLLKPSSGKWVEPYYIELTKEQRTTNFVGKKITGLKSGAQAFVDYLITRNVNGKFIDIAYLTKINNKQFLSNEIIIDSGTVVGAPKVLGSLNSISVTISGELFTLGELVDVISSSGIEGKARVSKIEDVSGVVRFELIDGGYGYTTSSNTVVAEQMLGITNKTNVNTSIIDFKQYETITQNLYSFSVSDVTGDFINGTEVNNGNTASPSQSYLVSLSQSSGTNSATVVLNQVSGNVFSNSAIYLNNRALIATNTAVLFTQGQTLVQRNTGAGTNNTLGVVRSSENVFIINVSSIPGSNGLHVGTYLSQDSTGASGRISLVPRESNFAFTNVNIITVSGANGNFNNTSTVRVYSNSSLVTQISSFVPSKSQRGYQYLLTDTNQSNTIRWATGNTAVLQGTPTTNTAILVSSDVGGKFSSYSNVSARGTLIAANNTNAGMVNLTNTFYYAAGAKIYGLTSNTFANVTAKYTGSSADYEILFIDKEEAVVLNYDYIRDYESKKLSGSYTGINDVLTSVLIYNSGSGYTNGDLVVFSGGAGSPGFTSGNATITTTSTGNISTITLSANVGSNIVSIPTTSITNSSGGSTTGTGAEIYALTNLSFPKSSGGDLNSDIISLLNFSNATIGSISSINITNPGLNYNINPFAIAKEEAVLGFGAKDIILKVKNISGAGFRVGEAVVQNTSTTSIIAYSNNFTGNTNLYFEKNEIVFSTDGISNTATGVVHSSTYTASNTTQETIIKNITGTFNTTTNATILTVSSNTNFNSGNKIIQGTANGILVSSNSTRLVVTSVLGTFNANSTAVTSNAGGSTTASATSNTTIYRMFGRTTTGNAAVRSITSGFELNSSMTGTVTTVTSNNILYIKREKLFDNYTVDSTVTGNTSLTTAVVEEVYFDTNKINHIGDNANVLAFAITSSGGIANVEVVSSGLGFSNGETVTITNSNGSIAFGVGYALKEGRGEGYYENTDGFLDDLNYLHDGNYYQNHSYEVQSSLPFDRYEMILKDIIHTAGKKMFGRVVRGFTVNNSITVTSSVIQS